MSTDEDYFEARADRAILSECIGLAFTNPAANEFYDPSQQLPFLEAYAAFVRHCGGEDVDVTPYVIERESLNEIDNFKSLSAEAKSELLKNTAYYFAGMRFERTDIDFEKYEIGHEEKVAICKLASKAAQRRLETLREKQLLGESLALTEQERMLGQSAEHEFQDFVKIILSKKSPG